MSDYVDNNFKARIIPSDDTTEIIITDEKTNNNHSTVLPNNHFQPTYERIEDFFIGEFSQHIFLSDGYLVLEVIHPHGDTAKVLYTTLKKIGLN